MVLKKIESSKKENNLSKKKKDKYNNYKHPKPAKIETGDELEFRIERLQIYMGYFVRRRRPIFTIGNLDRATDLDLLAIKYSEPFRREVVITECKGGKLGPLDRIFWLAGLRKYIDADKALLIRKGTKWNIKEFAKQSGIEIIDLFRVRELEKNYKIDESVWPSLSDMRYYKENNHAWNEALFSNKNIWELYASLSSEITYHDAFAGIIYLLSQMRLLTKTLKEFPEQSFYRYLLSECICQLLMFCMKIAEQSFDLSIEDREGFIRKGLTYGNIEPVYAERIMDSAYNLARQAVLHYTKENIDIEKSLFQIPPSPGTEEIVRIINMLLTCYPMSLNMPQICDFLLSEYFIKRYEPKGLSNLIFPQKDLSKRIDLVKLYFEILIEAGACPKYVINSLILPNEVYKRETTDQSRESKNSSTIVSNDVVVQPTFKFSDDK